MFFYEDQANYIGELHRHLMYHMHIFDSEEETQE